MLSLALAMTPIYTSLDCQECRRKDHRVCKGNFEYQIPYCCEQDDNEFPCYNETDSICSDELDPDHGFASRYILCPYELCEYSIFIYDNLTSHDQVPVGRYNYCVNEVFFVGTRPIELSLSGVEENGVKVEAWKKFPDASVRRLGHPEGLTVPVEGNHFHVYMVAEGQPEGFGRYYTLDTKVTIKGVQEKVLDGDLKVETMEY
ncbi:unnamed protein product [Moneuplotes crassus]|uniref:Uncharacterized protein n=1 Tax=Euplotes crassus TaxID=5936 RepID=A0AAD1XQK7_EUPCR|nr:unnamed protein product [Moneuplotes crassus]